MTEVIELEPGKTYDVTVRMTWNRSREFLASASGCSVAVSEDILSAVEVVEEPPVGSFIRDGEGDLLVHLQDGWAYVTLDGGPLTDFIADLTWSKVNNGDDVPGPVTIVYAAGRDA